MPNICFNMNFCGQLFLYNDSIIIGGVPIFCEFKFNFVNSTNLNFQNESF